MDDFVYTIAKLDGELKNAVFSQYYEIIADGFCLTDYQGNIYNYIIDKRIIKLGNMEKDISKTVKVIDNKYIIIKRGENLFVEDYKGNTIDLFYVEDFDYIDIDYKSNRLLLVYEEKIHILEKGQKEIVERKVEDCISCKFLDEEDKILIVENKSLENVTYLKIEDIKGMK